MSQQPRAWDGQKEPRHPEAGRGRGNRGVHSKRELQTAQGQTGRGRERGTHAETQRPPIARPHRNWGVQH